MFVVLFCPRCDCRLQTGMLPIHYAAANDAVKVVEALLDAAVAVQGARVSAKERLALSTTAGKALHASKGAAASSAAATSSRPASGTFDPARFRVELVEQRLLFHRPAATSFDAKPHPLPTAVGSRSSLVHVAAGCGAAEVVASCMAIGCSPNCLDANGLTPTLVAAYSGQFAPIMILAESGADLATADPEGRTAMAAAAEGGHTTVCEVLASMRAAQLVKSRGVRLRI